MEWRGTFALINLNGGSVDGVIESAMETRPRLNRSKIKEMVNEILALTDRVIEKENPL